MMANKITTKQVVDDDAYWLYIYILVWHSQMNTTKITTKDDENEDCSSIMKASFCQLKSLLLQRGAVWPWLNPPGDAVGMLPPAANLAASASSASLCFMPSPCQASFLPLPLGLKQGMIMNSIPNNTLVMNRQMI